MRFTEEELNKFGTNEKTQVTLVDWEGEYIDVEVNAVAKTTKYKGVEDYFVRTVGGSFIYDPYGFMAHPIKEFDVERNADYRWTRCTKKCYELYLMYLQSRTHNPTHIREAERRIHA